ncbi:hypothetical protein [Mycetocola spongiae]|uniref:hypothetical protein n=1 Tax=Mycetocola spongiae TaxID=2859226 RepID=UPI001CF18844|nr:hypothetical protein [Mycetocola spongiae]UCR88407.1 hypothetical protein KXZ72_10585 [Mycetocola spongiae]
MSAPRKIRAAALSAALALALLLLPATGVAATPSGSAPAGQDERTPASIALASEGEAALGQLFGDQHLIPGGKITASFEVVRLGGVASSLTLRLDSGLAAASPLARDAILTVDAAGHRLSGEFASLVGDGQRLDLGTGAQTRVPVQISVSLPEEATNITRDLSLPFIVRATAVVDSGVTVPGEISTGAPGGSGSGAGGPGASPAGSAIPGSAGWAGGLSGTGTNARDALIVAGGLVLLGLGIGALRRRRRSRA